MSWINMSKSGRERIRQAQQERLQREQAAAAQPAPEPAPSFAPIAQPPAAAAAPVAPPAAQKNPFADLSPVRQQEAQQAGVDLTALNPDELQAFAAGGVGALEKFRQVMAWQEEAALRPRNPNLMS